MITEFYTVNFHFYDHSKLRSLLNKSHFLPHCPSNKRPPWELSSQRPISDVCLIRYMLRCLCVLDFINRFVIMGILLMYQLNDLKRTKMLINKIQKYVNHLNNYFISFAENIYIICILYMSKDMRKWVLGHVHPVKTDHPAHLPSLIRAFALCPVDIFVLFTLETFLLEHEIMSFSVKKHLTN